MPPIPACYILGGKVNAPSYESSCAQIFEWADKGESRYVCFGNVHMIMESYAKPDFRALLNGADLVNPDGMPLVWTMKLLGIAEPHRVTAPDIAYMLCEQAAEKGTPIGFYGSSQETMDLLLAHYKARYPKLNVVYAYSPPFRPLTPEEDAKVVQDIVDSGARLLFMGLGCPKQERWMTEHRGRVPCVMLGVGATFDFHAGNVKRAPLWVQNVGLEWFHRLLSEPRRLFWRYFSTNPRFIALVITQILHIRNFDHLKDCKS